LGEVNHVARRALIDVTTLRTGNPEQLVHLEEDFKKTKEERLRRIAGKLVDG
jgi:hypothetical protein